MVKASGVEGPGFGASGLGWHKAHSIVSGFTWYVCGLWAGGSMGS